MAKDVSMQYIEDDIKKIQIKTNMYIKDYGPQGAFHLSREIIQNCIDECIDEESNGKRIDITYDISTDILTCEDDGRGFPEVEYPLDIFCTKNQSGSKFFRDQGGETAGEFGVGLTVTNALSDIFSITSFREVENTKHEIVFNLGEKKSDTKSKLKSTDKKHGSRVVFRASKKFLGVNTVLPYKELLNWIDTMTYFIRDSKLKINFDVYKGLTLKESHKFKAKPFTELLNKMVSNHSYSPMLSISGDKQLKERIRKSIVKKDGKIDVVEKDVKKNIHLDVALRYVPESETTYDSYCNYTNTTDGGVHLTTVERCFCNYMQTKTKTSMTDTQKEKTPILWDDIRSGLYCVINLSTTAQVRFEGNQKTKIGNNDLVPYMTDIMNEELDKFFTKNPGILNEFIKIIRINAKSRVEMQKVKTATQRERINTFAEHEMKNYIRCNNTGKKFKEIFLVEGNSASGSSRNGSDPDTQAFFLFRGVVANVFKAPLSKIMENREWHDLVTVLRCGIGKSFDIDKLYFDRINILTDEDIDGFGISSGMLAFFYKYYKPLIKAGKLYKVFSPLYRIDDKEHEFIANKAEMIEVYHKKITKNYKIRLEDSDTYMSKTELYDFLKDTYDYSENLFRLSSDLGKVNKFLLELIIAYMVIGGIIKSSTDHQNAEEFTKDQKFIKYLMSRIQKVFKEMTFQENGVIDGIADGKFNSIKISNRLIQKSSDFIPVFKKYGVNLYVQEKGREEKKMSIGQFLDDATKYTPKILTRYKGLGELDGDQLSATTLDINNRISVQYTMEDVEDELDKFKMIHGTSTKDLNKRKKLMQNYKIKRDDLDN